MRNFTDDKLIRCTKCGGIFSVEGYEDCSLYDEGGHDITCSHCGHDFRIITRVGYTFVSPRNNDE